MNLPKNKLIAPIDEEIYSYLDLNNLQSFLLFAGAGSGKTRTLVNVLQQLRNERLHQLIQTGQQVAIITYTNAACDEIKHRLQYDPIFRVSTIHSFTWDLIHPFTENIKEHLENSLKDSIADLDDKLKKAKDLKGKTAVKNARKKESKEKRLAGLAKITKFTYSASSNKIDRDSITHSEVIDITSNFIEKYPLMQRILINQFPILLIDESQDTNKNLLEAFIEIQKNHSNNFCLGLFGDMMQRIYSGGKENLDTDLPKDWEKPEKTINYRCPKRVISLINKIRENVDKHQQEPKEEASEGYIRLFIIDSNLDAIDRFSIEEKITEKMATDTKDTNWSDKNKVKCLILEHAMAAKRGGFLDFFSPLYESSPTKNSVITGEGKNIQFITKQILPLIDSIKKNDDFLVANIIKKYSPLLDRNNQDFLDDPIKQISFSNQCIEEVAIFLNKHNDPSLIKVMQLLYEKTILQFPNAFTLYLDKSSSADTNHHESIDSRNVTLDAWESALNAKLSQVIQYDRYIKEELSFATHQGVKGLQFKRVMVILDDNEANGFLFSYEKLFGAKTLSAKDKKNEEEGNDSSLMRTRRLFYVVCSRAEKSLAVVVYSKNPQAVKKHAIESKWFNSKEVILT